jgi:hypothetical protein
MNEIASIFPEDIVISISTTGNVLVTVGGKPISCLDQVILIVNKDSAPYVQIRQILGTEQILQRLGRD